jgi:hypothetical protein
MMNQGVAIAQIAPLKDIVKEIMAKGEKLLSLVPLEPSILPDLPLAKLALPSGAAKVTSLITSPINVFINDLKIPCPTYY